MTAVNVQGIGVSNLPEACCQMDAHVSADIHVFHFHALASPQKIDDVEVLEVATDVVSEIDAMGWVAARCSPVSGVTLQRLHSCQTQSVEIPVEGVLVHWSVVLKGNLQECG